MYSIHKTVSNSQYIRWRCKADIVVRWTLFLQSISFTIVCRLHTFSTFSLFLAIGQLVLTSDLKLSSNWAHQEGGRAESPKAHYIFYISEKGPYEAAPEIFPSHCLDSISECLGRTISSTFSADRKSTLMRVNTWYVSLINSQLINCLHWIT